MTLASVLTDLKLGDAEFAKETGLHRTQVWAYRVGRYPPDSANAAKILAALKKRDVDMELADLLAPPKKTKKARKKKAA